jgi:hypothetical protein
MQDFDRRRRREGQVHWVTTRVDGAWRRRDRAYVPRDNAEEETEVRNGVVCGRCPRGASGSVDFAVVGAIGRTSATDVHADDAVRANPALGSRDRRAGRYDVAGE